MPRVKGYVKSDDGKHFEARFTVNGLQLTASGAFSTPNVPTFTTRLGYLTYTDKDQLAGTMSFKATLKPEQSIKVEFETGAVAEGILTKTIDTELLARGNVAWMSSVAAQPDVENAGRGMDD